MKERYKHNNIMGTYSCDQNKIAKVSGILQETQEAGRLQMEIQKPSYDDVLAEGKALMLSRLDLKIYERINFNEELIFSSWPCPGSRATLPRMYTVEKDGIIVAEAATQWALVDIASRRVLKAEEIDMSNYYMWEYHELFRDKFKIPKDLELHEIKKVEVGYSNLDYNGHMNNTYYADILCDCVPELGAGTHRVESFRIHYNKEAPLGDILTINGANPEQGKYIFRSVKTNGEINIDAEIRLTEL